MKNTVKLYLFKHSELVSTKDIDINKWYDGDIVEIDSNEYRSLNNITLIKGMKYGLNGEIEESWSTYYNDLGRLIKSERYDSNSNLIDIEEIKYDKSGKIIK